MPLLLAGTWDGDSEMGLQLQSRNALADFVYEKPEEKINVGVELLGHRYSHAMLTSPQQKLTIRTSQVSKQLYPTYIYKK